MSATDPLGSSAWGAANELETRGYATGLGLCSPCLTENYYHDPDDPHLFHGREHVHNRPAITVMGGEGRCIDHAIAYIEETP